MRSTSGCTGLATTVACTSRCGTTEVENLTTPRGVKELEKTAKEARKFPFWKETTIFLIGLVIGLLL